jgi:transcriptional regulator with XRE-family HTH domain
MKMLSRLLQDKMNKTGASMRKVARDTGLSTTTVGRILNDESIDVDTLVAVCEWIGVPPSEVLDANVLGKSSLGARIAAAVSVEPQLAKVFGEAVDLMIEGKLTVDEFNDLINYTTYKLEMAKARDKKTITTSLTMSH